MMKKQTGVRNPHNLPTKVCAACQRPFTWRKKWERDWEMVRYCSDACRTIGAKDKTPVPSVYPVEPAAHRIRKK